jgi:hypothetical protein
MTQTNFISASSDLPQVRCEQGAFSSDRTPQQCFQGRFHGKFGKHSENLACQTVKAPAKTHRYARIRGTAIASEQRGGISKF